ncbi:hypothetical protein [Selenomonas sp. F0473]|uniref:hypothetical protein n=1 Tax=Selenomonas sp. F0473 TaxID=999423 RepID=UPI00029DEE0C|nr:hypothetical protein [Selenomonas sp. F0473]EKU72167.1 hypothetical protein HMPREF9161_00852 [Selenomonas sp. F0473]
MDTERKDRQRSIRAARDWLAGAEHAIAGEDDLAGDLKLMLARAELTRLSDARRRRLGRYVRWILPPLAALAVWGIVSWGSAPPAQRAQSPVQPAAQSPVQTGEEGAPIAETAQPPAGSPASAGLDVPPAERVLAEAVRPPQTQEAGPPQHVPLAESAAPAPPAQTNETSRIPNRDMQRLMQVGGKILRE